MTVSVAARAAPDAASAQDSYISPARRAVRENQPPFCLIRIMNLALKDITAARAINIPPAFSTHQNCQIIMPCRSTNSA
jgi:hypothetical protein